MIGNNFELGVLLENDLKLRVKWMSSPEIYKTMHFEQPVTMTGTLKWFERVNKVPMRKDLVLKSEGSVVAMTGLIPQQALNTAETYTFVNPELLNKGIGTVARFAALVYAFTVSKFDKVVSIVDADNEPSIKLSEKLGFKFVGIVSEELDSTKNIKKRYRYVCTKETFAIDLFEFEVANGFVNVSK